MTDHKYKVEDGIPIPKKRVKLESSKYPFYTMKTGDSFAVPNEKYYSLAALISKRHKGKFVIRRDAQAQWRCWRVK